MGACRGCPRLSPELSSLRAVCAYEGAARAAVHVFKYRGGQHVAGLLGDLMRQNLEQRPLHAEIVVPVPLSAKRRKERGYNQALLLAEQVLEAVGGTIDDVLEREDRPRQQGLDAATRRSNLSGTVRATRTLDGQRVLLVDDVATTCATLSVCADALKAAGARDIRALVFARDL